MCCSVLQCIAVCCSVLQCFTVCCSVALRKVCRVLLYDIGLVFTYIRLCYSCTELACMPQGSSAHNMLQCVAVCCSMSQCVAVCCSVLQCVAVCCSVYAAGLLCTRTRLFYTYIDPSRHRRLLQMQTALCCFLFSFLTGVFLLSFTLTLPLFVHWLPPYFFLSHTEHGKPQFLFEQHRLRRCLFKSLFVSQCAAVCCSVSQLLFEQR